MARFFTAMPANDNFMASITARVRNPDVRLNG